MNHESSEGGGALQGRQLEAVSQLCSLVAQTWDYKGQLLPWPPTCFCILPCLHGVEDTGLCIKQKGSIFLQIPGHPRPSRCRANRRPAQNHPCPRARQGGWQCMFKRETQVKRAELPEHQLCEGSRECGVRLLCQKRPGFQKSLLQAPLLLPVQS